MAEQRVSEWIGRVSDAMRELAKAPLV